MPTQQYMYCFMPVPAHLHAPEARPGAGAARPSARAFPGKCSRGARIGTCSQGAGRVNLGHGSGGQAVSGDIMASLMTTITDAVDAFVRRLGGQRLCEHCQQWAKKPYQSGDKYFCDKIHASIYFNKQREEEPGYRG